MHSALYIGQLNHRRFAPRSHAFSYGLFMVYLDLAELDQVFRGRWLWSVRRFALARFRREDHLGDPAVPLDRAVRDLVERETGAAPRGPIRLLTHLRYLGYCFNPVSLYYCYGSDGESLETVVAEVNNTPWGERHCYVLPVPAAGGQPPLRFTFDKCFHVSPFMPAAIRYDWRLVPPGEKLSVYMGCFESRAANDGKGDLKLFDATLRLNRREISAATLARALLRFPWMSAQVILGIYWQALRLWLKRVPVYDHPAAAAPGGGAETIGKDGA
jgi:DUF1365 family protein